MSLLLNSKGRLLNWFNFCEADLFCKAGFSQSQAWKPSPKELAIKGNLLALVIEKAGNGIASGMPECRVSKSRTVK